MHVRLGPFHDLAQLVPVVDVLEVEQLNGGSRDDETVVVLVAHLGEGGVEGLEVLGSDVFRLVADGLKQLDLDLKRRVGELAQDLGLGGDLRGHEVQQEELQRADVLVHRAKLRHDEDVLALESGGCGQRIRNADGHGEILS